MMSLSEIMFMAIVVYLLYRFIVNFLVPVMRATRQVRAQFKNMQDQANGGNGAHGDAERGSASHGGASGAGASGFRPGGGFQPGAGFRASAGKGSGASANSSARASEKRAPAKPPADDYIDFEEIK